MSEENVEVVQRGIETWNRRDLTAWLALYSPDAEIPRAVAFRVTSPFA